MPECTVHYNINACNIIFVLTYAGLYAGWCPWGRFHAIKILKSAEKIELRYDGTYARPNRLYGRGDTEIMTETDFCSFITSPKLLELI